MHPHLNPPPQGEEIYRVNPPLEGEKIKRKNGFPHARE